MWIFCIIKQKYWVVVYKVDTDIQITTPFWAGLSAVHVQKRVITNMCDISNWVLSVWCSVFELVITPELCKCLATRLESLDSYVVQRLHLYITELLIVQWKYAKISHQKRRILALYLEFPVGGMICLLLETAQTVRLQGRQYYIQRNG